MTRPDLDSVPAQFKHYVEHVKDMDVIESLKYSSEQTLKLIRSIPEDKGEFRYAEGKWSIKEVLNHMIDVERIMAYRALRFSRNDKTDLPPFEENDYAPEANASARTIAQLANELSRLRATTVDLFQSFTPAMLKREGTANKKSISVLTLGYVISGHESHHRQLFRDRYLIK